MLNWLRGLFGLSAGAQGATPRAAAPQRTPPPVRATYDNAAVTEENSRHWVHADGLSARRANTPQVRKVLRDRSRYEVANNSYASGVVATLANDLVGVGPRLQVLTGDERLNRAVEARWRAWAHGIRLADKLRTAKRAKTVDGEGVGLLVSNPESADPVRLDVLLVECEQMADLMFNPLEPLWVDGLRFDAHGNVTEYHFLPYHPGDWFSAPVQVRTVSPRNVLHWFRRDRPGQWRGVPELTPALGLFAQLRRFTLATLTAAETAASFAAMLESDAPANADAALPDPFETLEIERGMMTQLPAGWKMSQLAAQHPGTSYDMFVFCLLREICRCLHIPTNVALGDSSKSNFSSARLDHLLYRQSVAVEREDCEREVLDPLLREWHAEGRLIPGYLPPGAGESLPHVWHWPAWEPIDPQADAGADEVRLRTGTTTLAEVAGAQGADWRERIRQQVAEEAFREEVRKELGLDGQGQGGAPGGGPGGAPGGEPGGDPDGGGGAPGGLAEMLGAGFSGEKKVMVRGKEQTWHYRDGKRIAAPKEGDGKEKGKGKDEGGKGTQGKGDKPAPKGGKGAADKPAPRGKALKVEKPKPPTVDELREAITKFAGKPVTPEDARALAEKIKLMKLDDIKALRSKLGQTKGSGTKQKLADELVAKVAGGAEGDQTKKPAAKPEAKPIEKPQPQPDASKPAGPRPIKPDYSGEDTLGRVWENGKVVGTKPQKALSGAGWDEIAKAVAGGASIDDAIGEYVSKGMRGKMEDLLRLSDDFDKMGIDQGALDSSKDAVEAIKAKILQSAPSGLAKQIRADAQTLATVDALSNLPAQHELGDPSMMEREAWKKESAFKRDNADLYTRGGDLKKNLSKAKKERVEKAQAETSAMLAEAMRVRELQLNYREKMAEQVKAMLSLPAGEAASFAVSRIDPSVTPGNREALGGGLKWLSGIWAKGGGEPPPFSVERTDDRAHYLPGQKRLNIGGREGASGVRVAIHEVGHHLENEVPGVRQAAKQFLTHRLRGEKPVDMGTLPGRGSMKGEMGRKDNFEGAFGSSAYYVGKDYLSGDTEVVSMGLEKLYTDPVNFARADPEYCAFIVGLLNGRLREGAKP